MPAHSKGEREALTTRVPKWISRELRAESIKTGVNVSDTIAGILADAYANGPREVEAQQKEFPLAG